MSGASDAGERMRVAMVNVGLTRLVSKRPATDDLRPGNSSGAATQHKKRPALSSLSNSSNVPAAQASAQNAWASKPKARRTQQQEKKAKVDVADLSRATAETPPGKPTITVASLERKTVHGLCISSKTSTEKEIEVRRRRRKSRGKPICEANPRKLDAGEADESSEAPITISDEENIPHRAADYNDIDIGNKDPQMCGMYAKDIYQHLRMTELKRRPTTTFMESLQRDVNTSMRGILVDWLVEVAEEYKLVPDTLYLSVSYIDRFLSSNVVNRHNLQLLGVSCMLIAAKYEEICAPQVEEFCYITDNTYSKEELVKMERQVLNQLGFELTTPTIKTFMRRFMRAAQASYREPSLQLEFLGNYLAELSLVEYSFLKYVPSMIAASAVFLARLTSDPASKPWNPTLQHYTGYKASEIAECVSNIYELQRNSKNCGLPAVREKYRQHKFKCVANLPPPVELHFEDDQ